MHLLATHVYGFNLASKVGVPFFGRTMTLLIIYPQKWMTFIVTELKDVIFDEDAWEHLVLEQKTKVGYNVTSLIVWSA